MRCGNHSGPHLLGDQPMSVLIAKDQQIVATGVHPVSTGNDGFLIVAALIGQPSGLIGGHMNGRIVGCQSLLEKLSDSGHACESAALGSKEDGVRRVKSQDMIKTFRTPVAGPGGADVGNYRACVGAQRDCDREEAAKRNSIPPFLQLFLRDER
jgi:hypothetical protein